MQSILLYATQRVTVDRIAQLLTQSGINSMSYHAGKTDDQRAYIQREFINNRVRVLCCTIAFSMGIDKSDIQSVIHYDVPRAIENYVQEIGRAGRDGTLARCHMFLSNDDFFQLRRITLSDLLDTQSALLLTNKVTLEAKRQLYAALYPDEANKKQSRKKRPISEVAGEGSSDDEEAAYDLQFIKDFPQESHLTHLYKPANNMKFIELSEVDEFSSKKMYVALPVKALLRQLDLKKEVVLTMLNQLEKLSNGRSMFKVNSILPTGVQMRFHQTPLAELAEKDKFFKAFAEIASNRQGIYRCNLLELAELLGVKPYNIPKILYSMQHSGSENMTYDLDNECFILEFIRIPSQANIYQLSQDMLAETRSIEKNLVQKLNSMFFAARKVSLPSVSFMLKKESDLEEEQPGSSKAMYLDFSRKLNDLINLYFSASKGGKFLI